MKKQSSQKSISENQLAIFENFKIRRHFDEKNEMWYFSVVDIVEALTDSTNPTDYLKKLRKRDLEVRTYIGTNCPQIEMLTDTGKYRKTLAGNPEHLLRVIQAIPSKKAEPIKLWLAKVGYERMQEMGDPEMGINRARENKVPARKGGQIAKGARTALEAKTGKSIVTGKNFLLSKTKLKNKK